MQLRRNIAVVTADHLLVMSHRSERVRTAGHAELLRQRGALAAHRLGGASTSPFRPAEVTRYLLRPDRIHRWAPVAPALFHLALVHVHGRASVERAEAQALRRLR